MAPAAPGAVAPAAVVEPAAAAPGAAAPAAAVVEPATPAADGVVLDQPAPYQTVHSCG